VRVSKLCSTSDAFHFFLSRARQVSRNNATDAMKKDAQLVGSTAPSEAGSSGPSLAPVSDPVSSRTSSGVFGATSGSGQRNRILTHPSPSVVPFKSTFRPFNETSAKNLLESFPVRFDGSKTSHTHRQHSQNQEKDDKGHVDGQASCLILSCGEPLTILYTSYCLLEGDCK
jgi:hypothetical protein